MLQILGLRDLAGDLELDLELEPRGENPVYELTQMRSKWKSTGGPCVVITNAVTIDSSRLYLWEASLSLSLSFFFFQCTYLIFWGVWWGGLACGILVPQPGIEPGPTAVEARSPNHWTTREVPGGIS